MHENSLTAYEEERSNLSQRAQQVLEHFTCSTRALTDRQVMVALGYTEPNQVRPRITELIQNGYLVEAGKTKCAISGKSVRLTGLPDGTPVQMQLF